MCLSGDRRRLRYRVADVGEDPQGSGTAGLKAGKPVCLSLSRKRFDAVGDRNPALRTLHPDEGAWPEPTGVNKRAGFERSTSGADFRT